MPAIEQRLTKGLTTRIQAAINELESIKKDTIMLDEYYTVDSMKALELGIIFVVCEYFKVDKDILMSRKRRPRDEEYKYAYIVLCAMLAKHCDYTHDKIAEIVSRDRTSAGKAIKEFSQLNPKISPEAWLLKQIENIEAEITKLIES